MKPLVSVCMPTFNHERFIAKAIEGVLIQDCDFPVELLIGEDESSDQTRSICQRYAEAHPEVIKLVLGRREDVIRIQGRETGRANIVQLLSQATGKYIAICEGDDFWVNPNKLQIQVNFLERNLEYGYCFHDAMLVDENGVPTQGAFTPSGGTGDYPLENFFHSNKTATCTKLFRASTIQPPPKAGQVLAYDWLLSIWSGERGKIHFFDECWAAYRVHSGGLWQRLDAIEMEEASYSSLFEIDRFLEHKYSRSIRPGLIKRRRTLARLYLKQGQFVAGLHAQISAELMWLRQRLSSRVV